MYSRTRKAFCRAILILACLVAAAPAAIGDAVGSVVSIQGRADAIRKNGASSILSLKSPIYLHDKIVTRKAAKLQIMLNDNSLISQGEDSESVINEYVYVPGTDKASCKTDFAKGVFRVVTGQITRINPDRFKVGTRMATIGIRGCDLAFKVTPTREDIYIMYLPAGKTILIDTGAGIGGGGPILNVPKVMNIIDSMIVTLQPGEDPRKREIDNNEVELLFGELAGGHGGQRDRRNNVRDDEGRDDELDEIQNLLDDFLEVAAEINSDEEDADGGSSRLKLPDPPESLPSLSSRPDNEPEPTGFVPPPPPPSGPPPGPPPPPPPPPSVIAQGGGVGHDWSWGIWDDGSMDWATFFLYDPAATDFQAIVDGLVLHNLTGTGDSGALVNHLGTKRLLTGTCDLSVSVGQSTLPSWSGAFALGNTGGDSLNFSAGGNILTGGVLEGNRTLYSLRADGITYGAGTLTGELVEGKLAGPGAGTTPINGAGGYFIFVHGTDARVDGVFGSDLIP